MNELTETELESLLNSSDPPILKQIDELLDEAASAATRPPALTLEEIERTLTLKALRPNKMICALFTSRKRGARAPHLTR